MLFLLTGDVQIGKTRWLEGVVSRLSSERVVFYGMLSPGQWRMRRHGELGGRAERGRSGEGAFEKLGIDALLLPQGERFEFARRADLAKREGGYDGSSQSAKAGLAWAIDEGALTRANAHFATLEKRVEDMDAERDGFACECLPQGRGVLVVDELGRLELLRGEGLVCAMSLLRRGPNRLFQHAVVIVRSSLVEAAKQCLGGVWADSMLIDPDDKSVDILEKQFL